MFSFIKFIIKIGLFIVVLVLLFSSTIGKTIISSITSSGLNNTSNHSQNLLVSGTQKKALDSGTSNNTPENPGSILDSKINNLSSSLSSSFSRLLKSGVSFDLGSLSTNSNLGSGADNVITNLINAPKETTDADYEKQVKNMLVFDGTVSLVIDGDTIAVKLDSGDTIRVRLKGINTPEIEGPYTKNQCFSKEASRKMRELVSGKKVSLVTDSISEHYDKYGRLLAYVYIPESNTTVNEEMIAQGYAYEYTYSNESYDLQSLFKQRQQEAENNKLGLWAKDACNI